MVGFFKQFIFCYVGIFLGVVVVNGFVVIIFVWQVNNIVGDVKRVILIVLLISFSGVGGIYVSMVFCECFKIFVLGERDVLMRLYRLVRCF